jgi:hypothetical protein
MAFEMLKARPDGTGEANLSIPIPPDDTNTLKERYLLGNPRLECRDTLPQASFL